jgi:hypothetical protein
MPMLVMAHNAFFDLQASGFFPYFASRGWSRTFVYDKGFSYIFSIRSEGRILRAVSTTNYFQAPLADMGKTVGLEKQSVDFEAADTDLLSIYCFRDVEIVVAFMLRYIAFVQSEDLGAFRLTRASQALAAYRHRFMPHKVTFHDDDEVRELESHAYYGGRTEAFRIGSMSGGPFLSVDVNSMYPYCMKSFPMPVKLYDYSITPALPRARALIERFLCVAEVSLETDEPAYAVKRDSRVVFPTGRIRTFLSTPSLRYAVEHGHLRAVHRIAMYAGELIFSPFVDYFYSMRMEARSRGDPLMDTFAKLLLNSLYGKFGQYLHEEETIEGFPTEGYKRIRIIDVTTSEIVLITSCMNVTTTTGPQSFCDRSFYAIPAHVTDHARMLLWSIIKGIGPGRVLYCDTDSVKLRSRDLGRIDYPMHPTALGALKVEKKVSRLTIYGLKDYVEDGAVHIKGVPRSAVETSPGCFVYDSWPGQSTHLMRQIDDRYIVTRRTRVLERSYMKGRVLPSGRVLPLVYSDF